MRKPAPVDREGLIAELDSLAILRKLFPADPVLNELLADAAHAASLFHQREPPTRDACEAMGVVIERIWSRFEVPLAETETRDDSLPAHPEARIQSVSTEARQILDELVELDSVNSPLARQLERACEECRRTGDTREVQLLHRELKKSEMKSEQILDRWNRWYSSLRGY